MRRPKRGDHPLTGVDRYVAESRLAFRLGFAGLREFGQGIGSGCLEQAESNIASAEQTNVESAQNTITATDYAAATSNMSKFEILTQTGISALAQANSTEQMVTKLLQ